jgi:multidrug efflux pump subunit AcrA (membrane-fusion protein)
MEAILVGIYAVFVWLIFIKFKWLPWNTKSQVVVVTIPIVGLTALILLLNVFAPSSSDVRVIKYVVQVFPQVRGRVLEVPAEGNRPMKKGDVLFKIDPTPFEIDVRRIQAQLSLAQIRLRQSSELAKTGAGSWIRRFGTCRKQPCMRQRTARPSTCSCGLDHTLSPCHSSRR